MAAYCGRVNCAKYCATQRNAGVSHSAALAGGNDLLGDIRIAKDCGEDRCTRSIQVDQTIGAGRGRMLSES